MTTVRKMLAAILENQRQIKGSLDPKTMEKASERDEMKKYLSSVLLSVKKVSVADGPDGKQVVTVMYEPICETVVVDSDGETASTERFKAINALNLISYADMRRISAGIDEAIRKANT